MKTSKRIFLVAAAAVLAVLTVGCSFSVSTANISDAIMTDSIDADGKPGNTVTVYPADTYELFTSAVLKNAPDNTQVRITWVYSSTGETLYESVVDSGEISNRYVYSSISLDTPFPEGDYEVQYFIDEREEADATVRFRVTENAGASAQAYLEDVHMTSGFDEAGVPLDSIISVQTTGIWHVSAILRNTQPDTIIRFVWYDTKGNVIDDYDFNPQGETDVYIGGTMELTSTAPEGEYWVELYIDDATEPAAQVGFSASANGGGAAVPSAGFSLYTQEEGGFSIKYPTSWYMEDMKDEDAVAFYPMDLDTDLQSDMNAVFVIALKGEADGYTLDSIMEAWISETVDENLDNYTNVSQSTDVINGNDVSVFEYSWSSDGDDYYTMDFLFIKGEDLYVISFSSIEEALSTLFTSVEQMVLSFQIL